MHYEIISSAPLERVHSHLFGSTRTSSYSDFCYMLLFVDNFTRYTWFYLVKHKSEVFSKFLEFKETVEGVIDKKNQNSKDRQWRRIHIFGFQFILPQNDIKRELYCANIPQ